MIIIEEGSRKLFAYEPIFEIRADSKQKWEEVSSPFMPVIRLYADFAKSPPEPKHR
jgi:hypothetical protein